jgi:hypothetical protein
MSKHWTKELKDENASLKEELAKLHAQAKNSPISFGNRVEADEQSLGNDGTASFQDDKLVKPVVGDVNDPIMHEKLANEKFMQDDVEIHIHEILGNDMDARFMVSVNNHREFFVPGERKTVKRYIVEQLARAKKTTYKAKERVNEDGVRDYVYPSSTGLVHPFSVERDPHPRGREWLQHVLSQP